MYSSLYGVHLVERLQYKEPRLPSSYCAVSEEMEGVTGKFVVDCKIKEPNPQALNDKIAERLWKVSTKLVGLE